MAQVPSLRRRTDGSPNRPFRIGVHGRPQPQVLPFQPHPSYAVMSNMRSHRTRRNIIGPTWRPARTENT